MKPTIDMKPKFRYSKLAPHDSVPPRTFVHLQNWQFAQPREHIGLWLIILDSMYDFLVLRECSAEIKALELMALSSMSPL